MSPNSLIQIHDDSIKVYVQGVRRWDLTLKNEESQRPDRKGADVKREEEGWEGASLEERTAGLSGQGWRYAQSLTGGSGVWSPQQSISRPVSEFLQAYLAARRLDEFY